MLLRIQRDSQNRAGGEAEALEQSRTHASAHDLTNELRQTQAKKMTPAAQILFEALKDEANGDISNPDSDAAQLAASKPKRRRTAGLCARAGPCPCVPWPVGSSMCGVTRGWRE